MLQAGYHIFEVPIGYEPRTEKKLQPWRDGWPVLAMLLRRRFNTKKIQVGCGNDTHFTVIAGSTEKTS
jgi:hypothetical protein